MEVLVEQRPTFQQIILKMFCGTKHPEFFPLFHPSLARADFLESLLSIYEGVGVLDRGIVDNISFKTRQDLIPPCYDRLLEPPASYQGFRGWFLLDKKSRMVGRNRLQSTGASNLFWARQGQDGGALW